MDIELMRQCRADLLDAGASAEDADRIAVDAARRYYVVITRRRMNKCASLPAAAARKAAVQSWHREQTQLARGVDMTTAELHRSPTGTWLMQDLSPDTLRRRDMRVQKVSH